MGTDRALAADLAIAPDIDLEFATEDEAATWFAGIIGQGATTLPIHGAHTGEELPLRITIGGGVSFGAVARVIEPSAAGALCSVQPRADLREFILRYSLSRRSGRVADAGMAGRAVRFDTCLHARFRSFQHLVTEFVTNISSGGMFIRTDDRLPVGSRITVDVTFPDGAEHAVGAEVVRIQHAEGKNPAGLGVRFLDSAAFQASLEGLLQSYLTRKPRVLLVDDDSFFLRVLADGLLTRGLEVVTAGSGLRASHLITDLLYELDMVVLDLNMPRLDGRALLERLRRMGTEMDLQLVVVSAEPEEKLRALVGVNGADAALSKGLGVNALLDRIQAIARRI